MPQTGSGLAPSTLYGVGNATSPSSGASGGGSGTGLVGDLLAPVVEKGRIRVTVSATAGTLVTVTRIHPSGRKVIVRGMELQQLSGGVFVGWDYEAPIGVQVVYEAALYDSTDTTNPLSIVDAGAVTFTTDHDWLKDPLQPIRNVAAIVNDMSTYTYATPVTVHTVLGRPDPVTIGDVRQAASGQVSFYTHTADDRDRFHLLTSSGNVLLLQSTQASGVGNMYVALSSVEEQRVSQLRDDEGRIWVCAYQEVGSPAGDGAAFVTYQDLNTYDTYQDVVDSNASYYDLYVNLTTTSAPPTITWRGA